MIELRLCELHSYEVPVLDAVTIQQLASAALWFERPRQGCRALPACAVEPRVESDLKEGPVGAAGQVTRLQARSLVL